jgi:hypothetical protein
MRFGARNSDRGLSLTGKRKELRITRRVVEFRERDPKATRKRPNGSNVRKFAAAVETIARKAETEGEEGNTKQVFIGARASGACLRSISLISW